MTDHVGPSLLSVVFLVLTGHGSGRPCYLVFLCQWRMHVLQPGMLECSHVALCCTRSLSTTFCEKLSVRVALRVSSKTLRGTGRQREEGQNLDMCACWSQDRPTEATECRRHHSSSFPAPIQLRSVGHRDTAKGKGCGDALPTSLEKA